MHRGSQYIKSAPGSSLDFNGTACLILMDTEREKQIDLGSKFPYVPIQQGDCVVPEIWKEKHGLQEGDKIHISLVFPKLEDIIVQNVYNPIAI